MGGGGRGGREFGGWKGGILDGTWRSGEFLASLNSAVWDSRSSGEGSVLRARGGFALGRLWGDVVPMSSPVVPASPSSLFSACRLLKSSILFPSPASFFSFPTSFSLASSLSCLRPVPSGKELLPLPVPGCSSFRFFLGFGLAPKEEKPIVCARDSGEPGGEVVEADIVSIGVVEMAVGKRDGAGLLITRDWVKMRLRGESGVVVCTEDDGPRRLSCSREGPNTDVEEQRVTREGKRDDTWGGRNLQRPTEPSS